jgi:trehalose 6-phosphate synthase
MPAHIPRGIGVDERTMRVGAFPVGIETKEFTRRARRAARSSFVRKVRDSVPGMLVLGVDRLDYTKGITLRLEAFERFLVANQKWRGQVTYLQITPRSRSGIPEYADMEREIDSAAGRINGTYGEVAWTPVRYVNRAYTRTALAGLYRSARVALITPLRDGMNLVAKEFVASQDADDPGVLILSRFAGASAELNAALLVNPYDPEAVGVAIARALDMPLAERIERHKKLYQALLDNDIKYWGDRFLAALTGRDVQRAKPLVAPQPPVSRPTWQRGAATSSSILRSAGTPRASSTAAAISIRHPPSR